MTKEKIFLDFEASSLSWNSYPIEIGWGGSLDSIKSYLISPSGIDEWTDWNEESEKIHGISRSLLLDKGLSPNVICEEFVSTTKNKEIYTDNPSWDAMWLYKLFLSTGYPIPEVDILHIDGLLINTVCPDIKQRVKGLYDCLKLKDNARKKINTQHRAEADVKYLITLYQMAKDFYISTT